MTANVTSPSSPMAEATDLKSVKCGFESHFGHASVVQWIERWTSKPSVAGSIPARGTNKI